MKQETIQKQVFTQLDKIYQSAFKICEIWDTKLIPTDSIEKIIKPYIIEVDKLDSVEMQVFMTKYNEMLKAIVKACEQESSKMNSKEIPLLLFKGFLQTCKNAFQGKKPKFSDKFKVKK